MEFNQEQKAALSELFEKIYSVSFKVILMAKTAKISICSQEYTNITINDVEIEEIFRNIEQEMQFILNESAKISAVPDYLFWQE